MPSSRSTRTTSLRTASRTSPMEPPPRRPVGPRSTAISNTPPRLFAASTSPMTAGSSKSRSSSSASRAASSPAVWRATSSLLADRYATPRFCAAFACSSSSTKPSTPAKSDAARMPSFAVATRPSSGNARFATKMAMVKPTPPRMDAPNMWNQFTFSGSEASLDFTTAMLNSMMPSGLPTSRPSSTP